VGGKNASGGASGGGGAGGNVSAGGKGGGSGGSNVDAGCSLATDASPDHSTTTCGSTFNFEGSGNPEGATLLSGSQGFTAIARGTTPHTYCGTGSLAIAANFSGTTGALTKGEVDIPVGSGGAADLSGRTLTIHVAATPANCGEDLRFKVVLQTTTGSSVAISINSLASNFSTASVSLASLSGSNAVISLALEAFSTTNYSGTIYVDEIDVGAIGTGGGGNGGLTGTGGLTGNGGGTGGAAGSGGNGGGGSGGTSEPPAVLTVQTKTSANSQFISFGVRLTNNGTAAVTLSQVTLKYWYTWDVSANDTTPPTEEASCSYSIGIGGGSCTNVTESFASVTPPLSDADHVFILGFTSGAGTLAPGAAAEIGPSINKSDFSAFDQTNDYSYSSSTTFTTTTTVTVYLGGALVYGTEPAL
jgi:hypothetical protein